MEADLYQNQYEGLKTTVGLYTTEKTMNTTKTTIFRGKFNLLAALTILFIIGLGCSGSVSVGKPDMPSAEQQTSLVKQTLRDFKKGVESEDFSALVKSGSKELQAQVPAEKMKTAFQQMIDKKDVIVPILDDAEGQSPQYTGTPSITEQSGNYLLNLAGSFPTDPAKTNFNFQYVWQDSQWKLLKIEVTM